MKVSVTPLPCCLIVLVLAGICAKLSSEKCSFDPLCLQILIGKTGFVTYRTQELQFFYIYNVENSCLAIIPFLRLNLQSALLFL